MSSSAKTDVNLRIADYVVGLEREIHKHDEAVLVDAVALIDLLRTILEDRDVSVFFDTDAASRRNAELRERIAKHGYGICYPGTSRTKSQT